MSAPEIHVMVDLETLGLAPDSAILSIGACLVDRPDISFYTTHNLTSQPERKVRAETLEWWNAQDIKIPIGTSEFSQCIFQFNQWLKAFTAAGETLVLWANGTDFDIPLLYNAFISYKAAPAWKYNSVRDYRTLTKLFPQVPKPEFVGDKHNALADAQNQARHLQEILKYMALVVLEHKEAGTSDGTSTIL